jgi:sugar phosphate isomerase/epimerase
MKISIASYSFHGLTGAGMMDCFGYLESVKHRYGLNAADFWNGTLGPITPEHLAKVKQALAEREMVVANYHVDGVHVWENEPEARERNYRGALEHLAAAAELGAQTVRIDMGGAGEIFTAEQLDYVVGRYREYAVIAADHGFTVGPETHWGPSLNPAVQRAVYEGVNHPAYGVLLHIGHWIEAHEEEGDVMAAPWANHTHIDARITRNCLEEKVRLLLDAGYTGYWGVEHHSAKNEYVEVECQLAEVRRCLTKLAEEYPGLIA